MAEISFKDILDAIRGVYLNQANKVQLTGNRLKEPFSGNSSITHTFSVPVNGFVITNDGTEDLTFTIGTSTLSVRAGETFEEWFDPFTDVTVTTNSPFRAYGKG